MVRRGFVLFGLATLCLVTLSADSRDVSHKVKLTVSQVTMLQMDDIRATDFLTSIDQGRSIASARLEYGVTCVAPCATIRAILMHPLPEDVAIFVRMISGIGRSQGLIELTSNTAVDLLREVRGAEYNEIEITIKMPPDVTVETIPIAIVYSFTTVDG